jgi:hypothetical protein
MLLKERVKSSCAAAGVGVGGDCCVDVFEGNEDGVEDGDDCDCDCDCDDCCSTGNDRRKYFILRLEIIELLLVVTSAVLVIRSATDVSARKNGCTRTFFDQTTHKKRIARASERIDNVDVDVGVDFLSRTRCNIDFVLR